MCIRDSYQLLVIERGEKAGAVDADEPVRLRAAECCFIETVIFLAVSEMIEAFVTNLGKYNEGMLVGEWVKFPTTEEEMQKVFERIRCV